MPRLNITIPDELDERLAGWRDHMNISKLCAQAIEQELERLEHLAVQRNLLTEFQALSSAEQHQLACLILAAKEEES